MTTTKFTYVVQFGSWQETYIEGKYTSLKKARKAVEQNRPTARKYFSIWKLNGPGKMELIQ